LTTDTSPLDESRIAGEPISPREAVRVMVRIQKIRRETVEEFRRLGIDAARKKADAVKAKARAQLESRLNTVEDRKADAAFKSADAFFDADVAEVLVDACEKSMWVLKDDWDTCRSIGANERAEKIATEGYGS
jgi:chemotaxis regulatin CheY-phosphate phosphatase CheZ